ncbi:MAG: hypothetical protein GF368_00620 [Candidatus Aenigmarchaeota archaeon]|nr:hypothetical protein [Candidatus Aenigmarchaeota archaeon]
MKYPNNHQNKKRYKRSGRAYQPKKPFKSVEGADSQAWEMLSHYAVWVLMEFYKKFDGYNRNCLKLSYSEVSNKISNNTFNKAVWQLKGFGFIDIVKSGRLERNNTLYALTNRWKGLSKKPDKLNTISKLLRRIEKVKRINTPKNADESDKKNFRLRKKRLVNKIRYRINNGA